MICPVCKVGMIVVEYEGVELDYCVDCNGIWFDRNELDYLLSTMSIRPEDLEIRAAFAGECADREKPRRCPLCRKKMKKIAAGNSSPIILDRCERHGGYWFDGGELEALVRGKLPECEWKNVAGFITGLFPEVGKKQEVVTWE